MNHDKYDEETYTDWQMKLFDALGEKDEIEMTWMSKKPDLEKMEKKCKELGMDAFELIHRTEVVERYSVE